MAILHGKQGLLCDKFRTRVYCFNGFALQKHVRKVVGGFGKKSCVSTGVRKPGNTYMYVRHRPP